MIPFFNLQLLPLKPEYNRSHFRPYSSPELNGRDACGTICAGFLLSRGIAVLNAVDRRGRAIMMQLCLGSAVW